MTLKSYFAGTVEAALELARDEMGPEAVLVGSRKTTAEAKHLGEYEVTFARLPDAAAQAPGEGERAPAFEPVFRELAAAGWQAGVRAELAELRREFRAMRRAVWQAGAVNGSPAQSAVRARVFSLLGEAGVDTGLCQEIAAAVESRLAAEAGPPEDGRLERALTAELETRFRADPSLGRPDGSPRVAALVGPPGAGKTTTLVKLAVTYGLTGRRGVQLLTMDTWRVAAVDQLRAYAAILGAGLEVVETARAVEQAIDEHRAKGLILIDTPGFGARDMDGAAEVAAVLSRHPAIDVHLVLPASMKAADLAHVVDRFEIFRPAKLLFTRIDETGSIGPIFSESVRTGLPASFLADGQQVPEDLQAASARWFTSRIVERAAESARPAA